MEAKSKRFLECLGVIAETRVIALVGAGGKTALMYALAGEIRREGRTVVTTTTTKIFPPRPDQAPHLILLKDDPTLASLPGRLLECGHVTVGKSVLLPAEKVEGVDEEILDLCRNAADHVLVEADGAAGRPVKAPEDWEPVVPQHAELVVYLVGLDCLGKPMTDNWVFRSARFAQITGLTAGKIIRPRDIARLVTHPEGGLKHVPAPAALVPFLNKQDLVSSSQVIEETVKEILTRAGGRISRVVSGSVIGSTCTAY